MDAGIADTINRRDVELVARKLDGLDSFFSNETPWYQGVFADTVVAGSIAPDRAWLFTILATGTPGVAFDGTPADADWENLFSHFRAEILARRDPQAHPVRAAESPCEMV